MITVKPFKAVRPTRDKVHLVASRSYVSYNSAQLRNKLNENPYSFLHIIHPDYSVKKIHKTSNLTERFQLVRKRYEQFIDQDILIRDDQPAFYIYRQIKNGHPFIGIVAAISIEDYLTGKIKIHEHTLAKREETFTNYLSTTNINAEPVLLMSERSSTLEDIYEKYLAQRPEYDFSTTTTVRHQLWVIHAKEDIDKIEKAYASMSALYIADGHHRSASSAKLHEQRKKDGDTGLEPHNFCLAYIMDESSVRIYEFNRLVKDLNALTAEEFLARLGETFYINEAPSLYKPGQKGEFSMYLNKQWYALNLKHSTDKLDSQVLSDSVLAPILNIKDLRKDKRIAFMEGPRGMEGLKNAVDKKQFQVAFGLYPVHISELKSIADQGENMPPKSTWVEPKLRSGLVIYELT